MNQSRLFAIAIASLLLLGPASSRTLAATATNAAKRVASSPVESAAPEAPVARLGTPQPPSATQQDLAKQFADAINAKDASKLKALIAPETLQCFDQARQPYLDHWIQRQFRLPIAKDYQVTVSTLAADTGTKAKSVTFAPTPTHVLIVSSAAGGRNRTLHRLIAEQDGKWLIVVACPTKETLERFTKSEETKARATQRADRVMPQVKEPLTKEVRALLAKGDRMGATRLCAETLHTDPLAARVVVDRIGEEKH